MAILQKTIFSFFISVFLLPVIIYGQSSGQEIVVGTVGGENITYEEVANNFSSGNSEFTLQELENFLPLYLDYKAKLFSANEKGYYEDSALVAEHEQYAKQAAYAYWLEKEVRPAAFETYYERATQELKAYHILIGIDVNDPKQVASAKEKLNQAAEEIKSGVPLDEVNKKYSTVRNGRSMGGDLPWLTVGRTVKEFEDQVFNLEPGEISEPFATQFGYHIVLLQDKRPRTPARLTSHLFVRPTQDSTAYKKAHAAYDELINGENWNQVVQRYTEDASSRGNGGKIGWVSYSSNFAAEFVEAVNDVDVNTEFSEPVRTAYGFHIFKVDTVQTYASEEEKKQQLMQELESSNYFQQNNGFVQDYLLEHYASDVNDNVLEEYKNHLHSLDSVKISDHTLPSSLAAKEIFTIDDTYQITLGDYHRFLKETQSQNIASKYREQWFSKFTKHAVDSVIINFTNKKNPDFQRQSKSYLDGLVVYKINDDFLWNAATVDSSVLRNRYESNLDDYTYDRRPFYYLISAKHDSTIKKAINFINEGNSPDSINAKVSGQLAVSSDSTNSYQEEPYNRLADLEAGSFSEFFDYSNRRAVFYLVDILPARNMTFEEAFNRLLAEYQPEREQKWLSQLRTDYKVEARVDNLRKAYKQHSNSDR